MMKLIENVIIKNNNTNIAPLFASNENPDGFKNGQGRKNVEVHNDLKNIQENDWYKMNLLQWFIKEQADEELFSTPNINRNENWR